MAMEDAAVDALCLLFADDDTAGALAELETLSLEELERLSVVCHTAMRLADRAAAKKKARRA